MTLSEVWVLYVRACRQRRLKPTKPEGQEWYRQLKGYEVEEVRAALVKWDSDATPGKDGQPRSKWLPALAQLAKLAAAAQHERLAAEAKEPQDFVRYVCEGAEHHAWAEFVPRSVESLGTKTCGWCGAFAKLAGTGEL